MGLEIVLFIVLQLYLITIIFMPDAGPLAEGDTIEQMVKPEEYPPNYV
jgi:hypothetical protein